jgi:hypothetical protein
MKATEDVKKAMLMCGQLAVPFSVTTLREQHEELSQEKERRRGEAAFDRKTARMRPTSIVGPTILAVTLARPLPKAWHQ